MSVFTSSQSIPNSLQIHPKGQMSKKPTSRHSPHNAHKKAITNEYKNKTTRAIKIKGSPINWIIWNKNENKKYNKSKFLNPSFTGNLFTVDSQELSSISLIPINLPLAPFLYSSINCETV